MPRGRPPLDEAALQMRVAAYCRRYGASVDPSGLPAFPAGQRETAQHRQWLAIYRADRRLRLRAAAVPPSASEPDSPQAAGSPCPVCSAALGADRVTFTPAGSRRRPVQLHHRCSELARGVEALGAGGAARLCDLLWRGRRGRADD